MTGPGILIAKELTPAQAAELDPDAVQGIVLAYGSPSSHAAILARSRGIPALVAAGPGVLGLAEGTTVVIDGATGELIIDPPAATLTHFRQLAAEMAAQESKHRAAGRRTRLHCRRYADRGRRQPRLARGRPRGSC
jgi:phosphocarrier protein FPr